MTSPLVTVIVPNYNHARFLDRRLASVLGQRFDEFELLFLDDASTDDSLEVLEGYRADPRLRAIVNRRNSGGPFPQWNRGVREARGKYIWIAESDDDADPGLLESLVGVLESDQDIAFAFCESQLVDEQDLPLMLGTDYLASVFDLPRRGIDLEPLRVDYRRDGRSLCRDYQLQFNLVPNASAVVFRRDAYLGIGGAPETMRLCGDWLTWGRLMLRGDVSFIARPLNRFRAHTATVRSTSERSGVNGLESAMASARLARESDAPADRQKAASFALSVLLRTTILDQKAGPLPLKVRLRYLSGVARVDRGAVVASARKSVMNRLRRQPMVRSFVNQLRRPFRRQEAGQEPPRSRQDVGP